MTKNKLIPSIKWPNDILINKSKIAGILINITIPDKADVLNIGIGINIISNPKEVIYPATNLKKENVTISPNEMLNAFFMQFVKINKIFENNGIEMIFEMWNDLGHKIGDPVSVKVGSKEIIGKFNGLTKEGALIIIDKLGNKETILAGDVFALNKKLLDKNIMVIDVGNTNTVFALVNNQGIINKWRMSTVAHRTTDEYETYLNAFLDKMHALILTDVIISSVVPAVNHELSLSFLTILKFLLR